MPGTFLRLETAAVATLIGHAEAGEVDLVHSPAHDLENRKNPREDRRLATALWLNGATVDVELTESTAERTRELVDRGLDAVDALHVAFAEAAGARWMATTDDRVLAFGSRHSSEIAVTIVNPRAVVAALIGS